MDSDQPIAHIAEDGRCQPLYDHLRGAAELAAQFATEFGAGEWARLAGLWHDLGKYSKDFQKYIRTKSGRVEHSTFGAVKAVEKFGETGRILAYIIAGHHAGLPDWQTESSGMSGLAQRLKKSGIPNITSFPEDLFSVYPPSQKPKNDTDPSMWIRMLFSCLVDADFLDTEAFMEPKKSGDRGGYPAIEELLHSFNSYMGSKVQAANKTEVNRLRGEILRQCVSKAKIPPAIFSLTVPTGGGKTLSSMAFALNHAIKHGKRRIVYVIPYTSIIEQTADQFREIFGEAVIEHHSNFDYEDKTEETRKALLACENWDAPIIVTTSVQFFESLFSSRTSRCRKLHNIVNSVVVLDEAQLLPPDFLNPIIEMLKELHKNYGVTILLCTATQPALSPQKTLDFNFDGLQKTVEIMEDPNSLQKALKRTKVNVPLDFTKPASWEAVSEELKQHETVLCIVNRRDDCRKLHQMMPEGTIHLSALMCGAHRSLVIAEIEDRLKKGIPTRVISTQLVEAGVDLDFPVVYRALAGLDSIAQAAGRCNREGKLREGQVFIFVPPSEPPIGHLRQAAEIGKRLLSSRPEDPFSQELFNQFFKELYWLKGDGLDKRGILKDLAADSQLRFSFRTAAKNFRIIDESGQAPVLVRYGEGGRLIECLKKTGPERWLMRRLQRYVVNLPVYVHKSLLESGTIREIFQGIYAQEHGALYDDKLGFCPEKKAVYEPDELIC